MSDAVYVMKCVALPGYVRISYVHAKYEVPATKYLVYFMCSYYSCQMPLVQ